MKKITLIIFGLLLSFSGYAQLLPEGFEAPWIGSPAHPVNWTVINETGPDETWVQSPAGTSASPIPPNTGSHAAYLDREAGLPAAKDWLITPYFNMPVAGQLRFFSRLTQTGDQGGIYKVLISTNPDPTVLASYTVLQTWNELSLNPLQREYYEKIITLPAITGFVHIAFVMEGNDDDRWLIDDVKVVSQCLAPTTLSADNIGLETAELNWINQGGATSWNIEVILSGSSPTGNGEIYTGQPPFTKIGLLPDTEYKYYIKAICSDSGISMPVGPFFFSTAALGESCTAPIVIPSLLPYSDTNNTASFTDTYEGVPGTGCNATGNFLAGNDVVYEYTPTISGNIHISITNNGVASGLFIYDNCADIGVSCLAGGTGNATTPVIIPSFAATAGNTYYIVISTSTAAPTTPYTLSLQQVYCAPPTGLTAGDANATSAKLSWTAGVATSWQYAVQPANTGLPTGAGQTTTQNTLLNVTQTTGNDLFTPATNYEYWVRASCGDGTFSLWTGPYFFSTTQIPAVLNYTQNFETPAHGWSLENGSQPNQWAVGSAINNGGVKSLYITNDNSITNAYTININSVVHAYRDIEMAPILGQLNLSFDCKGIGDTSDYFRVWLVPTSYKPIAGTAITAAAGRVQIGGNFTNNPAWLSYNAVIEGATFQGEIRRLIFEWRNNNFGGSQSPAAIDNINLSVITCPSPTAPVIATNSLTNSQVTIDWTAPTSAVPGYDYYLSTNPTAPTGTTVPTNTTAITIPTVTITPLTPSNSYYFWVRSNCGTGDASTWTGPIAFVAPQVPANMDYTQNFDMGAHGWALNNGTQTNKWAVGSATSNSAPNSLYISEDNGTTNTYNVNAQSVVQAYRDIQMPGGLNQLLLTFDWKNMGENNQDYFRVWLVPTNFVPTPGTQITAGTDRTQIGGNFTQNGNWTTQTSIFNAASSSTLPRRLVFEWRNNNNTGTQSPAAIDNINLSVVTCVAPTAPVIAANSLTNNQVIINWTPPTPAVAGYDYYLSSNQTAPTDLTVPTNAAAIATPTVTISLTPSNSYYFWVRSNCGPGDVSIWTGPIAFVAPQVPAPMDYTQNFDTPIHGWALNNGTQTNKWAVGTATSNSAANSLYISEDNGVTNTYNVNAQSIVQAYRDIQMPTTLDQLLLSFDWKNTGENNTDYFRVWIVPTNFVPTPGTQITAAADRMQIGGNYMQSDTWTTQTNVINGASLNTSVRRLVFEWRNNANTGTQSPAAIDNISLKLITCPQPSNIVMTVLEPGVATFTWTATTAPPASYDYYIATDGIAPTATTTPTGNTVTSTTTATINNLPPSTNHNIWVRSNCSGTDKSFWIGPLNFTTPQVPATMTYTQNFDLGTHGWDLVNGTQTNKWVVGSATSNSVTNSLYVSNDNGVTNAYTNTAGSVVQAYRDIQLPTTLDQLLLTFDWKSVGDGGDYLRVWMVPINYSPVPGTQITAGTDRVQIGGNFTNNNSWVTSNTIIPSVAYGGKIRRLVFEWRNDTFGGTVPPAAIDNISLSVVTCPAPTNLLMPTLTATSATFTWTPPASVTPTYEYYNSLSSTPPTASTTPTGVAPTATVTLTPLPDSSNFFFWVRSNCGPADKSLWLGPFEYSTPQVASPLNYVQNFDGTTYGWSIANGTQTNKWVVGSAVNNSPSKSLYVTNDGGANNTYTTNSASVVHAYKDIIIPAGTAELDFSFDWKNQGETPNWDVIRVWRVPTSFVPTPGIRIAAATGHQQIGGDFVGNGNWSTANYILNSTGYPTTIRLVFEWRNDTTLGSGNAAAIDNIDLSIITCPKPTTLGVSAIGQTGATFDWTEVGTAPEWEVYVVPAGSAAPTATSTGVAAPNNPFVYTTPALNGSTDYVYYVRSACGTNDKSKWSGPIPFKTKISNDECTGAYTLGVNAQTDPCLVSLTTSYDGATPSSMPFDCATTNGADIWYQFVATEDRHNVELSNFTGAPTPVVIALYEGDQCGSLLQLNCSTTNVLIGQNLIPGNTYKVRLILDKANPVLTTTYKICINTPQPPSATGQSACTVTTINYSFENPLPLTVSTYPQMINQNTVQGWRTTAADDVMEFWPTPSYENVDAYEGSQFIELNANLVSGIYQDYPTPQSIVFNYSFAHRGRWGVDVCKLLAGPPGGPYVEVTSASTDKTAWSLYTGTYTTPTNQPITRFIFQSVSSSDGNPTVGNFLDAIKFTADNSVLSVSPSLLNCTDNVTTVTAVGYGEWSAYEDNPGETIIADTQSNTTTIGGFTASGVYKFDWTTQYCKSTIEVTYDNGNVAEPIVVATIDYCVNETAVPLTATPLADHTLQWYTTAVDGTASTTAPTPDTTIDSVVTYYVSQLSIGNCESPRTPIEVTVHALPLAPVAIATIEYCQNTTATPLTADALAGHTLNWYTVPTGGTASATAPTPNTTVPATTKYYVSQTSGQTCEGDRTEITVIINPSIVPVTNFTLVNTICIADVNPVATLSAGSTTGGHFSAETGLIIDITTGEIDLAASTAGTYLVTYTVDPDLTVCNIGNSTSVSIIVTPLAAAVASFSYTTPVCTSAANQSPVLATGFTLGGTFTSSDAGLVIDPTTGAIDMAASTDGSYTVTYDVAQSLANCVAAGNGIATIVITQQITPVTDFDYNSSFCFGTTDATPNLAIGFVTGGVFKGTTGLVIDATTGQVNIAASTSGTHTVTYTVTANAETCNTGNSSQYTFTINGQIDFALEGKCNGSAFIITATPAEGSFITTDVTYEWATASGTAVGLNSENFDVNDYVNSTPENEVFPLEFTLTVTNNGCETTKSYLVEDIACTIQKGISPNNDGLNDNFDLKYMGVKKLTIFNRYGQDVYTKGNYKDEWYGQSNNGNELPTGTYYYVIERSVGGTTTGWIYINRQE